MSKVSVMSLFENLTQEKADPIFKLSGAYAKDPRPSKVNLGVGAYKNADVKPFVLPCVRKAEKAVIEKKLPKEYLPIQGDKAFLSLTEDQIFGTDLANTHRGRFCSAQSLGGTGALHVGASFLKRYLDAKTIYVSDPTWANHKPIFTHAGLAVDTYPYYSHATGEVLFSAMCERLKGLAAKSVVLLHACCHNPTGMSLTEDQWKELSSLIKDQGLIPFFDCAYQGFGSSFEKDAFALRHFLEQGHEMLISYSYSKNMSLYNDRLGALCVVSNEASHVPALESIIKVIIRRSYSNPPAWGSSLAKEVLSDAALYGEWQSELTIMRNRIVEMRHALSAGLAAHIHGQDFSGLKIQQGMFSLLRIHKDQVDILAREWGVYMPDSGRINVAGLSSKNINYVIDAISAVL
jgi:aspartate/tyrosine/aromatic aminotransferase